MITAHSAHIHGYQHYYIRTFSVCYQRIPKYTQRTTIYTPTHNTKSIQRTATRYQLHTYNYIRIAQSETLYTNDHLWLKTVAGVDHNHCKTKLHKITKNSLSELNIPRHACGIYSTNLF